MLTVVLDDKAGCVGLAGCAHLAGCAGLRLREISIVATGTVRPVTDSKMRIELEVTGAGYFARKPLEAVVKASAIRWIWIGAIAEGTFAFALGPAADAMRFGSFGSSTFAASTASVCIEDMTRVF